MFIYLASVFVYRGDELVLGPVHGTVLVAHIDERNTTLGVVGVDKLSENLASLLVLRVPEYKPIHGLGIELGNIPDNMN